MTGRDDYSQLQGAIAKLPDGQVRYGAPDPARMAEAFAAQLGVEKEHFQKELRASREELEAKFARHEEAMREEMDRLRRQHEEMSAEHKRRERSLQQEMEERIAAKDRVVRELERAAPTERAELERLAAQTQRELQRAREEQQQCEKTLKSKLAQSEAQIQRFQQQVEERTLVHARNYSFGGAGAGRANCLHRNTRRWGNQHGSGRKCVDCKVSLPP